MDDFLSQLKKSMGKDYPVMTTTSVVSLGKANDFPVLAEIAIRSTELHKIANGNCCILSDGVLGIRFLLKNSFKVKASNFVVNNFIMQVVALGKDNVMHKEDIAVKTKVQQVIKEKIVKTQPKKEVEEATQAKLKGEEIY